MFAPIYKGAGSSAELNTFLMGEKFELLILDYTGAGNKYGRYTLPGRFGRLLSTDAVWTVAEDRIFSGSCRDVAANVIRIAYFYIKNNATDLAIDILLSARRGRGVDIGMYSKEPLYCSLQKEVLHLFKSLLYLPQINRNDI